MTDDEVKQWLSISENKAFRDSCDEGDPENGIELRQALRALAEARRVLAIHEWDGPGDGHLGGCLMNNCTAVDGTVHDTGCFFTTMPRPK